jgi:sugar phosphate isomerase/epimerase
MSALGRLTYCTNVHPAESLAEVNAAIAGFTVPIKARVAPNDDFNVGLRLSARASKELSAAGAAARFREQLSNQGLYVTTLNGFPYGAFHGTRVKEAVYRPDWQEAERLDYTRDLFRILAELLPTGQTGSVSTVPGCFGERVTRETHEQMTRALHAAVIDLCTLERNTGKTLVLALEPEPSCVLETTSQTLDFFERFLLAPSTLTTLGSALGVGRADAERTVRRHLGVCLDACHASVEHESPLESYRALLASGITVGKIQVSAGLALSRPDQAALDELSRYDEDTYLHQTVVERDGTLRRYLDLPEAIATEPVGGEWRVHFHVPVFRAELGAFGSTQRDLIELLAALDPASAPVLEVETYTWGVLPAELRERPLVDAIAEELSWTVRHLGASSEGHAT